MYNIHGDKMSEIYLVRHGQTDANKNAIIQGRIDNPLNNEGINQAKRVGQYLKQKNIGFDFCISSPLERAIVTTEIIKNELKINIPTMIEPEIIERDFGELDGQKINDNYYKSVHQGIAKGIETDALIEKRVKQFFLSFFKNNSFKRVLMVSHSHVIKALLKLYKPSFSYDYYLKNCSINIIKFDNDIKIIKDNIDPLIET